MLALHRVCSAPEALDDLWAPELAEWPGGVVRARENLFGFCVVVFPRLCVTAKSSPVVRSGECWKDKTHPLNCDSVPQTFSEEPCSASRGRGTDPMLFTAGQSWVFLFSCHSCDKYVSFHTNAFGYAGKMQNQTATYSQSEYSL